ncbi:MAG: hypothetical protein ACXAB4_09815 [Candidatus Hodarchaeales archaeon]|jgi:hypothetical protein
MQKRERSMIFSKYSDLSNEQKIFLSILGMLFLSAWGFASLSLWISSFQEGRRHFTLIPKGTSFFSIDLLELVFSEGFRLRSYYFWDVVDNLESNTGIPYFMAIFLAGIGLFVYAIVYGLLVVVLLAVGLSIILGLILFAIVVFAGRGGDEGSGGD